jgi:hypothetical protein
MPYITQPTRKVIDPFLKSILTEIDGCSAGELNYIITSIIHKWIEKQGLKYTNLNAAIGVLDCAKMELYRMIAAPYEDKKIIENGCISKLDGNPDEFQKDWKSQ